VNHIAAKIIDGISARPGPHAAVRLVRLYTLYVLSMYMLQFFSARQHAERAICYRPSVRLSVCLSVCLSVRHTGGSVKNG